MERCESCKFCEWCENEHCNLCYHILFENGELKLDTGSFFYNKVVCTDCLREKGYLW